MNKRMNGVELARLRKAVISTFLNTYLCGPVRQTCRLIWHARKVIFFLNIINHRRGKEIRVTRTRVRSFVASRGANMSRMTRIEHRIRDLTSVHYNRAVSSVLNARQNNTSADFFETRSRTLLLLLLGHSV